MGHASAAAPVGFPAVFPDRWVPASLRPFVRQDYFETVPRCILYLIPFAFLGATLPFPVDPSVVTLQLTCKRERPRPSNRGASHLFVPSAQCKGGSQFAHAAWGQSTTGPNSAHSQHVQPTTGSQHGPKARTQWYQVNKMSLNQVPARSQRSSTRAERFLEHLSLTSLPPCPPLHPPC